jgi:hypothetical protein
MMCTYITVTRVATTSHGTSLTANVTTRMYQVQVCTKESELVNANGECKAPSLKKRASPTANHAIFVHPPQAECHGRFPRARAVRGRRASGGDSLAALADGRGEESPRARAPRPAECALHDRDGAAGELHWQATQRRNGVPTAVGPGPAAAPAAAGGRSPKKTPRLGSDPRAGSI